MRLRLSLCAILVILMLSPLSVLAHQPRITDSPDVGTQTNPIIVPDPEVSKAYYGRLNANGNGGPAFYEIVSSVPFALYVNILVPDIAIERDRRFSVEVLDSNGGMVALLDGGKGEWTRFYEPFGGDSYFMGPEYRANMSGGTYVIKVFRADGGENIGRYVLAVGEKEEFPPSEILSALVTVPRIKQEFFGVAFPFSLFASPMVANFIYMIIAVVVVVAGVVVFFWRLRRGKREGELKGQPK